LIIIFPKKEFMALLEITDLSHNFGGLAAVSNFSLEVAEGELVGLIGPNGAGKTTIFNLITGLFRVSRGTIKFQGEDITRWPSHRISSRGVARTFQNIRLFKELSVLDNVRLGGYAQHGYNLLEAIGRSRNFQKEEERQRQRAYELLERFNISPYAGSLAKNLPYGEQRRVEMARALISGPRLLLLDEPAAGMNQSEAQELIRLILEIKKEFSLTIILIEHQMRVVMNLCQRVKVLDFGETIATGAPQEIHHHPAVLAAYLGRDGGMGEDEPEKAVATPGNVA
jgi:branched-chain amino acid transport system ATP-binding protein